MSRRKADDPERLARRAAGGDLVAALRLATFVAEKNGVRALVVTGDLLDLLDETLKVTRDVLLSAEEDDGPHEDGQGRWDRGGRGYDALELARISKIALEDPNSPWKEWLELHREDMDAGREGAGSATCPNCGDALDPDGYHMSGSECDGSDTTDTYPYPSEPE